MIDQEQRQSLFLTSKFFQWVILVSILLTAHSAYIYAKSQAAAIDPAKIRNFSVRGDGKVVVIPDIATFSFSVLAEGGTDLQSLTNDHARKINTIIDFLHNSKIDKEDIETSQYAITPRYQNFNCSRAFGGDGEPKPCPPPEIVGYSIIQSTKVTMRDFNLIGGIIRGVVDKGANNVSQLQFTVEDRAGIETEAREMALREAREKARALAKAGKFKLGDIITITEGYAQIPQRLVTTKESFDLTSSQSIAPSIEPGKEEIRIQLNVVYQIR